MLPRPPLGLLQTGDLDVFNTVAIMDLLMKVQQVSQADVEVAIMEMMLKVSTWRIRSYVCIIVIAVTCSLIF